MTKKQSTYYKLLQDGRTILEIADICGVHTASVTSSLHWLKHKEGIDTRLICQAVRAHNVGRYPQTSRPYKIHSSRYRY